MEENKTLVDQLRHMVASTSGILEYPTTSKAFEEIFGRTCRNAYDEREIFNVLADRIEREYLPRPRFEDGEPVQFGDMFYSDEHGSTYKATMFVIYADGSFRVNQAGCNACQYEPGERVKRPEPDVLDADGVPIHVGDTVYFVGCPESFDVLSIVKSPGNVTVHIGRKDGTSTEAWPSPGELTHEQPDSLERIAQEAAKSSTDYWGCDEYSCGNCPAKQEGNTPCERYGVGSCRHAMVLDLLRRQRELLGGDE